MNRYKTIGIIGGQGPASTADFYLRIIKYYQDKLGAKYLQDYPPMIIYSVPSPDLVEGIENEEQTFTVIAEAIKKLEKDGADFIIIACNSLQYLNDRFQALVKIPIIRIASVVNESIKEKGYKTVGILSTKTTINKGVYNKILEKSGVKVIPPQEEDQQIVSQIILNIIGGHMTNNDTNQLKSIIDNLHQNGAEAILLACTELPLAINRSDTLVPLIDCNEIYINEAARYSSTGN